MEAESWLGIYRRYRQFHDGFCISMDPSNEQIKANLLKPGPLIPMTRQTTHILNNGRILLTTTPNN